MVATYTAVSLGMVFLGALLGGLGLWIASRAGMLAGHQRMYWQRQLRVAFGATFLMAAVAPYVALNFSMSSLVPFLAIGGLIIAAWGWGASRLEPSDLEI